MNDILPRLTVCVPPRAHRFCVLCDADCLNQSPVSNETVDNVSPPEHSPPPPPLESERSVRGVMRLKKKNSFAEKAVVTSCTGRVCDVVNVL